MTAGNDASVGSIREGIKRFPQMAKRFPQMAKGIEEFSAWVDARQRQPTLGQVRMAIIASRC